MIVLVVEDTPSKAAAITNSLQRAGVDDTDIHVVPDIGGAKRVLAAPDRVGLLILDIRIPNRFDGAPQVSGGLILLQWIERKEIQVGAVVGLSAYDPSSEDTTDLARYGVAFFKYQQGDMRWSDFLTAFAQRLRTLVNPAPVREADAAGPGKFGLPGLEQFNCDFSERESQRSSAPLGHAFIDLDDLKQLNQDLNHDRADIVIGQVAASLRELIASRGQLYHRSGDEFVVLLDNHTGRETALFMERCCAAIAARAFETLAPGRVTVSVGVACLGEVADNAEQVREAAIRANQRAKDAGKNRVELAE